MQFVVERHIDRHKWWSGGLFFLLFILLVSFSGGFGLFGDDGTRFTGTDQRGANAVRHFGRNGRCSSPLRHGDSHSR